jgi:hypothetical protein
MGPSYRELTIEAGQRHLERLAAREQALAVDPFLEFREKYPRLHGIAFHAEAQLIHEKQSRLNANDRLLVLKIVQYMEAKKLCKIVP